MAEEFEVAVTFQVPHKRKVVFSCNSYFFILVASLSLVWSLKVRRTLISITLSETQGNLAMRLNVLLNLHSTLPGLRFPAVCFPPISSEVTHLKALLAFIFQ